MTASPRVSVVIPSRNEQFLVPTVRDLLAHAVGSIEVIAVLDGYWPPSDQQLPNDPRLRILHRGDALGMRPAINAAVAMSRGQYLLKSDGHCLWPEGYDDVLVDDYREGNWILTPRRYALDAEAWRIEDGNNKYPVDYEYLSYPFERMDDPTCGLHGTPWTARRDARRDVVLDADMSSQGSAWFMSRAHWDRTIGKMDMGLFGNFYGESQEIGLKTQVTGGAMMRTKRTWYAHLRKGKKYGRGYALGVNGHRRGAGAMLRLCMLNQWPGQTRTLQSLIEEFAPVPGWPADLDECFQQARQTIEVAA